MLLKKKNLLKVKTPLKREISTKTFEKRLTQKKIPKNKNNEIEDMST